MALVSLVSLFSELFPERLHYSHLSCIIYDDALSCSFEVVTYSEIFAVSSAIACLLRKIFRFALKEAVVPVVAVLAEISPCIFSAIISIWSIPATYCPIDTNLHFSKKWETIISCGASVIIVHISQLKDFLAIPNLMTNCIKILTQFMQNGIVIAILDKQYALNMMDMCIKCTASDTCRSCDEILKSYNMQMECQHSGAIVGKSEKCCNDSHIEITIMHPSSSIAYILHTSGSTGVPKKVSVPQGCITANIVDLKARFSITAEDRVFNAAPLTFDPSLVEMFLSLSSGACLVVVPDVIKATPSLLSQVLNERQKVTVLQITPSVFNQIPENIVSTCLLGEFSFLRVLAFGGEVCPGLKSLAKMKNEKNSTRIFNIYGITEVSCWATCHEILFPTGTTTSSSGAIVSTVADMVPIGECLLDTMIELRDRIETDVGVEGTLWIGGCNRVCLVGEESELCFGTWRNSGDVAFKDSTTGHLYIIGRIDRQIKRKGHRVNMDHVQQVISSVVSLLSKCSVISVPGRAHELALVAAVVPIENAFDFKMLFEALNRLLPSSHIPDRIVCLDSIPVNHHGKCDYNSLCSLLECQKTIPKSMVSSNMDRSKILDMLMEASNTVLAGKGDIKSGGYWLHCSLTELGANSFDIVRIINLLEEKITNEFSACFETAEWFEPLLTKPIGKVVDIIYESLESEHVNEYGRKRQPRRPEVVSSNKVPKLETVLDDKGPACIKTYRRGVITINGSPVNQYLVLEPQKHQSLSLRKLWAVPTGKCVDSSPLVVTSEQQLFVVYIGSHSGLVLSIQLDSGIVQWTTQLPERLESSPCLSVSGCQVIIGCYDGCVYTLNSMSGVVEWCFKTDGVSSGDPVKSSAVVYPSTGFVWFGSHDKHVYCIDIHTKKLVHKLYLDGGSCFSSPVVSVEQCSVYIGTLKGNLFSIDVDSGQTKWCYHSPKPIFSSPAVLVDGSVAFGCVDGCVYVVNSLGEQIQILETNEPIFSSCVSVGVVESSSNRSCLYAGSHDSHMYCWEFVNKQCQLIWKCKLDSSIYSTCMLRESNPHDCMLDASTGSHQELGHVIETELMCVCSCEGTVYLIDVLDGSIVHSVKLPGQVFSSPAIVDNRIVVGCRDESVYCYGIQFFSSC